MTRCVRRHYRRAAQQVTISFMNPSLPFLPSSYAYLLSLNASSGFPYLASRLRFPTSPLLPLLLLFSLHLGSHARAENVPASPVDCYLGKRNDGIRSVDNLNYISYHEPVKPTPVFCHDGLDRDHAALRIFSFVSRHRSLRGFCSTLPSVISIAQSTRTVFSNRSNIATTRVLVVAMTSVTAFVVS